MFKTMLCLSLLYVLCYCGRVKRVVGGGQVDCGKQISIASLRNSTRSKHLCGATIISPRFALTAAHCVHYKPAEYFLSLNNYCVNDNKLLPTAEVLEIITHELYHKYTRAHDIALLHIKLDMDNTTWLNENILPKSSFGVSAKDDIRVKHAEDTEQSFLKLQRSGISECTIYGYGSQDVYNTKISDKLLAGNLRIISLDECTQLLSEYVAPAPENGMMCAVGNGVDSCQGDSGGPLMCGNLLEGICSHGTASCGVPGVPGIYTSIGAHIQWIREVLNRP